jgi:hypothetical protein
MNGIYKNKRGFIMALYFSSKTNSYLEIKDMATPHIANAIRKIRSGTHKFYTANSDYKLIQLLLELEDRNTKQLAELKEQVASIGYRAQLAERRIATDLDGAFNRAVPRTTLEDMRKVALRLIARNGLVTADTLRLALKQEWSYVAFANFHALAHVFRDKRFKKIGFLQSKVKSNHGRYISVWGAAAAL